MRILVYVDRAFVKINTAPDLKVLHYLQSSSWLRIESYLKAWNLSSFLPCRPHKRLFHRQKPVLLVKNLVHNRIEGVAAKDFYGKLGTNSRLYNEKSGQ
jgi:hypothetical protein